MADDFDPDAFLAQVGPAPARIMSYGPIEGEYHHDAMFGPEGNALQPYDVAASPDMGLAQNEWIRVNGQLHRVADASYLSPGNPTSQTIELRDQHDQGTGAVARAEPFDPDAFLNHVKPFNPDEFLSTVVAPSPTPASDASQVVPTPTPSPTPDTGTPAIPPSLNPIQEEPVTPPPAVVNDPGQDSSKALAETPPIEIPNLVRMRQGQIVTADQLTAEEPQAMKNAVDAGVELLGGLVPKSLEDVKHMTAPQTYQSTQEELARSKTEFDAVMATPPYSKERFLHWSNLGAQILGAVAPLEGALRSKPMGGEPNVESPTGTTATEPRAEEASAPLGKGDGQTAPDAVPETGQAAVSEAPEIVSLPAEEQGVKTETSPVSIAPAADLPENLPRAREVQSHLKPSESTQKILDQQEVQATMAEPAPAPEGGALFGAGGKRAPKTTAVGITPLGDKNWLRIPSWVKRAGRGLMTEGTRNVLERTKNQVGRALAKATRQHVDIEQELFGMHDKMLRDAIKGVPKERLEGAFAEVGRYIQDVENKRPTQPLLPDAQRILDAWNDVAQSTGDIATANNVQVFDPKTGKYRPMGRIQNFIPRMFKTEVETVLRDPTRDPALFNQLAQEIANHRSISVPDAAAELRGVAGRFQANDHMANLEMARSEQLPEIFYEYDLRNLASRYIPAFSERMAQIIAYGQRLGTREAPLKKNLWDIARRESEDPETQQWLNDAEDQATGFHPKSPINRTARRAQALGNALLLSDPTTTVVRNLLSGLAVTTERFGIGRSLMQMVEAGKTAARMGAREIGVIRDDIGAFLQAEQLGDSKLDSFIRELQTKALTLAGFTGSETFVRSHNAAVASTFARDAAQALETKPKSGLAREALAHFKRLDVNPEKIVAEKGDWKTGPETRKFIRSTVRESQGGYRFDQVPLWAGSTTGRFLYQYGRWSIQRAGDIFRNTIKPALGETVEFRGQTMTRRNVLPLMRLGLFTVGLGETFAGIANVLFDRDRKDASLEEIAEAWNKDEMRAAGLLGERMVNDIIMAGTLGLLSQPIDFIKSTKDQSRFKNPADPPSMAGIKALTDLAQKAWDQGGSLTKRDILDAAASIVRGPKNVTDVIRAKLGDKLYQAQNDQRTLRNAARRWAQEQEMDISPPGGFGDYRKSPKAPVFEEINDALMSGDAATARSVAAEFIKSSKDPQKAKKAVDASVKGKEPFRAGQYAADKYEKAFLKWTDTHMSDQDRQQIHRVINVYNETAKKAGLTKASQLSEED